MSVDPRHVSAALRAAETRLQALIGPGEQTLHSVDQETASIREQVSRAQSVLRERQEAAQRQLESCLAAQRQSDRPVDCSRYERQVDHLRGLLDQLQSLDGQFEQAVARNMGDAAQFRSVLHNHIPTAIQWLRERDAALGRFESSGGLSGAGGSTGGGGSHISSGNQKLTAADAMAISSLAMALTKMGSHGSTYRRARQEYLRSLVDDPKQPRYVRGWIRQEINRIERAKTAVREGRLPPGKAREIHGIPGLDVGHRYPDIDLPQNFRLEDASVNRRRVHIARRLGVDHLFR